jgi:hypothetical protein
VTAARPKVVVWPELAAFAVFVVPEGVSEFDVVLTSWLPAGARPGATCTRAGAVIGSGVVGLVTLPALVAVPVGVWPAPVGVPGTVAPGDWTAVVVLLV